MESLMEVEAVTQETATSLSHAHSEFRIRHGDGSIRWIESRSMPHREADGSIVWTGVLLDITQRKQAEERVKTMAGTVTASFGVAELSPPETSRLLAQRVDEALYRAKDRGRNRVEV